MCESAGGIRESHVFVESTLLRVAAKDERREKKGRTGDEGSRFPGNQVVTSFASAQEMRLYYPDRKWIRDGITGQPLSSATQCTVHTKHPLAFVHTFAVYITNHVRLRLVNCELKVSYNYVPATKQIKIKCFLFHMLQFLKKFKAKNIVAIKKLLFRRAADIFYIHQGQRFNYPDKNYSN